MEVPIGFVVTFDSIPRSSWSLVRPNSEFAAALVIHDYLYWTQTHPRAVADDIFKLTLADLGVSQTTILALFQAVRAFGQAAWDENARLKAKGEKRILKEFPADPLKTRWEDSKQRADVFKDASP